MSYCKRCGRGPTPQNYRAHTWADCVCPGCYGKDLIGTEEVAVVKEKIRHCRSCGKETGSGYYFKCSRCVPRQNLDIFGDYQSISRRELSHGLLKAQPRSRQSG